ncbi:MAG: bifunctional (p)ppGpp synthetase/guanosine-3',5'-bis(diphosphate) 3'-pyrophosphohydrolase, partial [Clostridia bacterium]|nr:bifunctional (p)ppGpp synthetase/guanosine-3',5'-bis(diphosphate) 3'-pyrophosphohydrolase [Clostridia bacterium]
MAEKTVSIYDRLFEAAEAGNHNLSLITRALECATQAHRGQYRRSGEPYVMHPLNVALILIELGMDSQSVAAALLHDVVEDTALTTNDLKKQFGKEIALLVEGVTKLGKVPNYSREEQQAENIRKMLFAMAEDVRVIIIKLADRLHNMRTIEFHKEQKRRDIALETIEVYAPIAHRLGIRTIKEELEDLAMYQLDPVAYDDIERELATRAKGRDELLVVLQHQIKTRLKNILPNIHIEGRIKSIYGIYRKMYIQQKTIDEIYDVYAMRIIVDTVNDCYNVLGVIHDMFRPIPGRFKDYISTPKQNRYQSLHTTVFDKDGVAFEVQIRTWEMHETAEYGIAAHWKYKANLKKTDKKMEDGLTWIRQLLDSQKEVDDVGEIVRNIKTDLTFDETFAVTPRGDIINLPAGATVIDFAYAIHSAIGNRMTGAKVNGRIVPIDYQIKTGEVVEIITGGQGKGPARDWLNIVKTSEARTKIRAWFKKERRAENIAEGKATLEKAM